MKTAKQLERYFKGSANHHRINILFLVSKSDGVTLEDISTDLNTSLKTISGHTHKLVNAGLLNKKYQGRNVIHSLSPYGERFVFFLKSF